MDDMNNKFDWSEYFKKVSANPEPKNIAKCKVCGDLLFYADDDDFKSYGWHRAVDLDTDEIFCLCGACSNTGYCTTKEAEELDKEYEEKYGSSIDPVTSDPYRCTLTWDESQEQKNEYKEQLFEYIKKRHKNLLNEFCELTKPHVDTNKYDDDGLVIIEELESKE